MVGVAKKDAAVRERTRPSDDRRSVAPATVPAPDDRLIGPQWWVTSVGMATAALLIGVTARDIPDAVTLTLLAAALLICFSSRYLARFEGQLTQSAGFRLALVLCLISFPMGLFGGAIAYWVGNGVGNWQMALAALAGMAALGSLLQAGRRDMILFVHLPLWGVLAAGERSASGIIAVLIIVPVALLISRKQAQTAKRLRSRTEMLLQEQRRAQDMLQALEHSGQYWFWETDRRGNVTYLSSSVVDAIQRPYSDIVGGALSNLFDMSTWGEGGGRTLSFYLSARSPFEELSVRAAVPAETGDRWWSVSGQPVFTSYGGFSGFRGSGYDLTEEKKAQQEVSRLAQYDSLTGLANRHRMLSTLKRVLAAPINGNLPCAIFLLDLDRFKQVNDTLGHPAGDTLLKQVAQRLQRVAGVRGKVGRLGGDEFQIILGAPAREDLAQLAHEVISALSQPYFIDGNRVVIGASIGIAMAPDHGQTSAELIRNADLALYASKRAGRGCYHFYADELHLQALERHQLEQDLQRAIHNGGLELHYQPIIDTATDEVAGFEAMLRWKYPLKGVLSLNHFVNVTEDKNLISAIGEWALRTACHDLSAWPDHIRVAVNISHLQFGNPQLASVVANALARAGVGASRLELEITENVFLNDDESTDAIFAALKRVGVRLVLDNFGTGNSSLSYLKKVPFDKIKIDPSFVRGATQPGSRNGAIAAAVAGLARSLGMESTAQGVETADELHLVRLYGCSHAQGGLFAGTLSAKEAGEWLVTEPGGEPATARSARMPRHTVLRKVVLDHDGRNFIATLRNISVTGALVQGIRNIKPGTGFMIALSDDHVVAATCRWCEADLMGLEFSEPLERDINGQLRALSVGSAGAAIAAQEQRTG